MRRKFTESEVKLARRIYENEQKKQWEAACQVPPFTSQTVEDWSKGICNQSLQPTGGPTPSWWVQAVAETDDNMVFVQNAGWASKSLWDDVLSYEEELKKLELECSDDDDDDDDDDDGGTPLVDL